MRKQQSYNSSQSDNPVSLKINPETCENEVSKIKPSSPKNYPAMEKKSPVKVSSSSQKSYDLSQNELKIINSLSGVGSDKNMLIKKTPPSSQKVDNLYTDVKETMKKPDRDIDTLTTNKMPDSFFKSSNTISTINGK